MVLELPDYIQDLVDTGSFVIRLDVDTRDEEGWMEQVIFAELEDEDLVSTYEYTLHETWPLKTWEEAEAECQSEGGHLASVTSEEVNEEIRRLAGYSPVWIGLAKMESGEWSWSDNSTYSYN